MHEKEFDNAIPGCNAREYGVAYRSRMDGCAEPMVWPGLVRGLGVRAVRRERRAVLNRVFAFETHEGKSIGGPQSQLRSASDRRAARGSERASRGHHLWTAFARQS